MLRGSVLLVALFTAAPTIWAALKDQTLPVQTAMVHFLIAVPIVAVLLGLMRTAMAARGRARPARTAPKKPS